VSASLNSLASLLTWRGENAAEIRTAVLAELDDDGRDLLVTLAATVEADRHARVKP
jgi:hypothetical protein